MDMVPGEQPQEQGRSWAARATVAPLRLTSLPGKYNNLEVGGAYTHALVPEGRNHLQGEHGLRRRVFDRQYDTKGPRTRLGLEVSWAIGPAFLAAEYIVSREAREGQGVGNQNGKSTPTCPRLKAAACTSPAPGSSPARTVTASIRSARSCRAGLAPSRWPRATRSCASRAPDPPARHRAVRVRPTSPATPTAHGRLA